MWSHQRLFRQAMLHCSEPSAINLSVLQADWQTVIVSKVGGYQMVTSLAESIHVQMPDLPEQNSSGSAFCESCVSSAYFWKSHPWSETVSDRGWEQSWTVWYSIHKGAWSRHSAINKIKLCDTPYARGLGADTVPSTKSNCGILHTQGGLEQTQCHQQNQTVGYSIRKGAWSRHSAINKIKLWDTPYARGLGADTVPATATDWLVMDMGCKLLKQHLKLLRSPEEWNDQVCWMLCWGPIWQSKWQASHPPSLIGSQEHSAQQVSMLWSFL